MNFVPMDTLPTQRPASGAGGFSLARALPAWGARPALLMLMPLLAAVFVLMTGVEPAQAIPSFARQTGQPCSACHTTLPELTPFGRRFKLGGYTLGGSDLFSGSFPPVAGMVLPSFSHTAKDQSAPPASGFKKNDNVSVDQVSAFYGGTIVGDLGAFIQGTYDGVEKAAALDNTDIRYARNTNILGKDTIVGISVNNNPTVQDVWNTTPAWGWPQFGSALAPQFSPPGTIIQEALGGQVAGVSAYTFWNDMVYAEVGGYFALSKGVQNALGTLGDDRLTDPAPYARVAIENTWGAYDLMVGGFVMATSLQPGRVPGFGTDDYVDAGFDSQLQYMGEKNVFTLKFSDIYETGRLHASVAQGNASKVKNHLNVLNVSGTWVYDHDYSLAGGFFDVSGSKDMLRYADSATGSPHGTGVTLDASWSPFMDGGPDAYKTFNFRLGLQYTHYFKLFGSSNNFDGAGHNASDNDTTFLYALMVF